MRPASTTKRRDEMFNVRIDFQGLCAFVPGEDPATNPNPSWLGVFLVGADEWARKNYQADDLPPHYPFVRFKLNQLVGQEAAPADICYWRLQNEDVVMLTGNPSAGGVAINRYSGGTAGALGPTPVPPRDATQEAFFDWLPPIGDNWPNAGTVHNECFQNDPSGRVSARIHLTEGR